MLKISFLFNPIHNGIFRGCSRIWGGRQKGPPSLKSVTNILQWWTVIPYLKKIPKIYESRDTPLEFCWHSNFSPKISKFCYIKKCMCRLHFDTIFLILLTFLESLKIILRKKVTILMMSAKMATPGLLKINSFWNKGYDVTIYVHDVSNKIWSSDSKFIVNVVMWPKFDDSSISMKEVITTILWWIDQKKHNLGLAQDPTFAFYTSLEKWFKLIVRSLGGTFYVTWKNW